MKLALASDTHLEFGNLEIKNQQGAELLILAGDIMPAIMLKNHPEDSYKNADLGTISYSQKQAQQFRQFLANCASEFEHVIYVPGNHEHYGGQWVETLDILKNECDKFANLHFLEQASWSYQGITFLGASLWTDMNRQDPLTLTTARDYMQDYSAIKNEQHQRRLMPIDTVERHQRCLNYLKACLANHTDTTVVVTHHAPSHLSTHARYAHQHLMNGAFRSDLSELILDHPKIKLWCHGHTHDPFDYYIGTTRVVCNPRGYRGLEPNAATFKLKYLEI